MYMFILGYGEDALTFKALTEGIEYILSQLKDDSEPHKTICFFRPSFGRGGRSKDNDFSSNFGEFDAIIGTHQAVYLVETKWSSSRMTETTIPLADPQIRRHKAFRAYLNEWRRNTPKDWADFSSRIIPELHVLRLVVPTSDKALARNLEYVLHKLAKCGPKTVDVLLFCKLSELESTPTQCGNFQIIPYLCKPEKDSSFICLSNQGANQ